METYTVIAEQERKINFAPATVTEEVLQNVWMILVTTQYDCPLARGLGLSREFVDKPIETAKALCVATIYEAIEKYEPRAKIQKITFNTNAEKGTTSPIVEVSVNDEDNEEYEL